MRRSAETGDDWASAWKQHYHVDHIGRHTVIVPSWIEYTPEPGEAVVLLDPGERLLEPANTRVLGDASLLWRSRSSPALGCSMWAAVREFCP